MPIQYRIFPTSRILVTRYVGHVTEHDLLETYREIYGLEEYELCRVELVDAREKTVSDYTMASFMTLNEMTKERFGPKAEGLATAVLLKVDGHLGMANLYRAVTDLFGEEEVSNFTSAHEALAWLQVPPEERQAIADWLADQFVS